MVATTQYWTVNEKDNETARQDEIKNGSKKIQRRTERRMTEWKQLRKKKTKKRKKK